MVAKVDIDRMLKKHKVALSDFITIKRNCFDLELPITEKADRTLVVNTWLAEPFHHLVCEVSHVPAPSWAREVAVLASHVRAAAFVENGVGWYFPEVGPGVGNWGFSKRGGLVKLRACPKRMHPR